MASPAVDISHGITIDFTTSNFSAQITNINPPGSSREALDTSHQESDPAREFIPEALFDNGELTFTCHYNPDTAPPIGADPETIIITFTRTGANWSFTGFMTNYQPSAPHNGLMTAEVTVKVSGEITIDAGS